MDNNYDNVQLELFEQSQPETTKNDKIEWAYSKREMLEQCPRRYYYQYYGSSAKTAQAEPQKETLQFLKTLTNRYLRTGDILHRIIRTYFQKLREGETWSPERLLRWAQEIYQQDRDYSCRYAYNDIASRGKYGPAPLLEFYYQLKDAEELYMESGQRLLESLKNFMTSATFSSFRAAGSYAEAIVEKRIRVKTRYFSAMGQVDLVYQRGYGVNIIDWKVGNPSDASDSLQLLFYALWASKEYQCQPEKISIHRAHLLDDKVSTSSVSERSMQWTGARIMQDLERMHALDRYGKNGIAEAFTPCRQRQICLLCPFQGVCPRET